MLNSDAKKEALSIHGKASDKYNATIAEVQKKCEQLYFTRQWAIVEIEAVEALISSVANTPKEFETKMSSIKTERIKFRETESYAAEAYQNAKSSGVNVMAGVAAGMAFASMAPTAAMWAATTFGTASTGAAISTLYGAAAASAKLAWLGGGALVAGGGGVVGGQALLAMAGPIGWGISAATTAFSLAAFSGKNKKVADEAIEEAKKITIAGAGLAETGAIVAQLDNETKLILDNLKARLADLEKTRDGSYAELSDDDQTCLGTLVNNALSLAESLNKTVG
ncbi:MAG: hypothetical protein LBK98_08390 [Peptococcaceae bacterium]|nr:hypothetical protein [Peptococcaceae bacterium]